jgi:transposase-like protein
MHQRKWDAKTKAIIIIEGLQGQPVAKICNEHQISQSQSSQWRDQFLAHAANAFEVHQHTRKEALLEQENARLKKLVGGLTLMLKKATNGWHDAAAVSASRTAR